MSDKNVIHDVLDIIKFHRDEVKDFIEHRFEAKGQDLSIAQELLDKLNKSCEILNNPAVSIEQKSKAIQEVSIAFEQASKNKNDHPREKTKINMDELRSDRWWSFFLTEAGEKTLNEVILGFMQEDQKKLSDACFGLHKSPNVY